MFFNKSKKLLLSAWLLLGGLALSSCSSFFGDSGYLITNLTTRVDEDGNTIVTITFDDEDISPVTFTIPKGISGEPGVGIASITPKFDSEKQIVTLTITYTDETLEPTVIEVPVISGIDGKNGKGITNVIIGKDEIGNTTFQFQYSDNTTSEVFTINKGVDGIGIKDITNEYDADNNRIAITITYTNDETTTLYVSCGEDGNGIEGITAVDSGTTYLLTITYTDGTMQRIPLAKPVATQWYSGNGVPSPNLGNDGDFYLNESGGEVYKRVNGIWQLHYQVTFNPNGGQWRYVDQTNPGSAIANKTIIVEAGSYVSQIANADFEVIYEGHTFNGWYNDKVLTPNSGHFTTLTPVMSDLTLFANRTETTSSEVL